MWGYLAVCKRTRAVYDSSMDEAIRIVYAGKLVFFCRALTDPLLDFLMDPVLKNYLTLY